MSRFKLIIVNKNYSSWSLRGWLALKHVGVDFEEILLPLWQDEFWEKIGDLSPSGTVPVLHDSETVVWDSLAIIDYLDKKHPEANIWPKDLKAYAKAKSISAEMHSSFFALRNAAPMNLRENRDEMGMDKAVTKDVKRIETIWSETREEFGATCDGGGDFLFGDFSGADMMYSAVVARLLGYGIKLNDTCIAYMKAVRNHPHIQEWYAAAALETLVVDEDELAKDSKILSVS
jgi:glutathione S-transferase